MPQLLLMMLPLVLCQVVTASAQAAPNTVRFATLNAAMGLSVPGELARRLDSGEDPDLLAMAEVIQRVRPDVLLLNEFDYTPDHDSAQKLLANYLSKPSGGQAPVTFEHFFSGAVNTGVDSGLDIDGNGRLGDPADAWGFGRFPGQYGMLILSRFAIDIHSVRTFQHFLWRDMPGALQPFNPDGTPFYDPVVWNRLRLSSKSHWDLPIRIGEGVVHLLASHPTPPAFDGPEDRNGRRNHDEIRLWADYIDPARSGYLVDDAGRRGGLEADALFVIAGDLNADPRDGGSNENAIRQLLEHPGVNARCEPRSEGAVEASRHQGQANAEHEGDPATDTADFSDARVGNLRADYVLPSARLDVSDCGVFWPPEGMPGHAAATFSDHRLVWIDVRMPPANNSD
jgi:endonuclease/exonuclease/phosphatase family metal-dependent hydrolase